MKVFVKNLVKICDGKFAQRKLCQSYSIYTIRVLSKVFIPRYLSVVNSKTNKMAEFEECMVAYVSTLFTMVLWADVWGGVERGCCGGGGHRICFNTLVKELTDEDLQEYNNYICTWPWVKIRLICCAWKSKTHQFPTHVPLFTYTLIQKMFWSPSKVLGK